MVREVVRYYYYNGNIICIIFVSVKHLDPVYDNYELYVNAMTKWTGNKQTACDAVHDVIIKWSDRPERFRTKSCAELQAMFMRSLINHLADKLRRDSKSCELKVIHEKITHQPLTHDIDVYQNIIHEKHGWFTSQIFNLLFIEEHKVNELSGDTNISKRTLYYERKKIQDELRRLRQENESI